jgi:serine/threonine protein kinase
MGDVYRATDTALGRDVALKILRPALAADEDHMRRFAREARILATLNHPNIAAIYGLEQVSTPAGSEARVLVLELVQGETLDDRIRGSRTKEGLPLAAALDIAEQIAAALEAAHEQGIVHRDLKPANVTITDDGVVKVLDFGIASGHTTESLEATNATTIVQATCDGDVLGTPAYMSPEQARGRRVDARADIWAFGCVLFELLTGQLAFDRPTLADTIAAVLGEEPDWSRLPASTPPGIVEVLRWCLEKDPRRRLRHIADARLAERRATIASGSTPTAAPSRAREVRFRRLTDLPGTNEHAAISPDGRMVAFVAMAQKFKQIWVQLLSGGPPLQVTRDPQHHQHPRWTPDSGALIYSTPGSDGVTEGMLWEMPALGGAARPIAAAFGGADIGRSGNRVALVRIDNGTYELVTVNRDGFDPVVVAAIPDCAECLWPRWSPDETRIALHVKGIGQFAEQLRIFPAAGGEPRVVASASSLQGCAWLPDNETLLYSSSAGSTLPYPHVCNLRSVKADGTGDRQVTFGDDSLVLPDVHPTGRIIASRVRMASDIWRIPVIGSAADNVRDAVRITHQTGQVQVPSVSPDGKEIVYLSDTGGHPNLWLTATDAYDPRQLTFERDPSILIGAPLWSPASDDIVFVRVEDRPSLWLVKRDGRGLRPLVKGAVAACWSKDGRWVYFTDATHDFLAGIRKIAAAGGEPVSVRRERGAHGAVAGQSVLYFSRRSNPSSSSIEWDLCRAAPEDGAAEPIGTICGARLPLSPWFVQGVLSPDERWIALPLIDNATTNLYAVSTSGGEMRQVTDFGDRPVQITRSASWTPDGNALYVALAPAATDVILYDDLL